MIHPIVVQILVVVVPLFVFGILCGRTIEKRHFRSLEEREKQNTDFIQSQLRSFPLCSPNTRPPTLVVTEVVIASDYLKSFLASWRNLFGGEVRSFSSLQERAKRESVSRLIDQAKQQGYNAICNVRIESADVGGGSASRKVPMAAVLASATAYCAAVAPAVDKRSV